MDSQIHPDYSSGAVYKHADEGYKKHDDGNTSNYKNASSCNSALRVGHAPRKSIQLPSRSPASSRQPYPAPKISQFGFWGFTLTRRGAGHWSDSKIGWPGIGLLTPA